MAQVSIVYFSGYGHTRKQAEAVADGVRAGGAEPVVLAIDPEGNLPDDAMDRIMASQGVIFGSPTYMGGAAWQFKKFADASSKPWFGQAWRDKVAAGFTNSGSLNGDKAQTITYFVTLAMQHSMLWVGPGLMPANASTNTREDLNSLGGFSGALAQSPTDASPDVAPNAGDLGTARHLGERVAKLAAKLG